MVSMVGAAVAIAPALAHGGAGTSDRQPQKALNSCSSLVSALIHPLEAGAALGDWTIERVGELHAGACTLEVSHQGALFFLDICSKDDGLGAPRPPARSSRCDLFIANEGDGSTVTIEQQGLFAMAMAEVVRGNEMGMDLSAMLTLRQRLAQHPEQVRRRAH